MRFFILLLALLLPKMVWADGGWGGAYVLLSEEAIQHADEEGPDWLPDVDVGLLPWHYRPGKRSFALGDYRRLRPLPLYLGAELVLGEDALVGVGDGVFSTPDMVALSGQVAYGLSSDMLIYAKSGMAWAEAELGVTEGRYAAIGYTYRPNEHFSFNLEVLGVTFGETGVETTIGSIAITGHLTW
jgi:hypothetical protein